MIHTVDHRDQVPKGLDAIVVFGVSTNESAFSPRLKIAAEMLRAGVAEKILLSGRYWGGLIPGISESPRAIESVCMRNYLLQSENLADVDVLLEANSYNTIGNLVLSYLQFIKPMGWKRVVILAHQGQFEKIMLTARKVGIIEIDVYLLPTPDEFTPYSVTSVEGNASGFVEVSDLPSLFRHPYYVRR